MARWQPRDFRRPRDRSRRDGSHDTPGARRRASVAALLIAVAVLAVAFVVGCRGDDAAPAPAAAELPELVPIPANELTGAAPAVIAQLAEGRARVDELAAARPLDRDALAAAWMDLGLTYLVYDLLDAAGASFENARRLAPESFRPHYLLGYLEQLQGRLDEAERHLERARAIEPDYPPTLLRLGRVHLDRAAAEAAVPLFRRALELDADAAAAWEGLGRAHAAAGDERAAIAAWEKALALQPGADSLHYAIGQAWRRLGDLDRAREELAAAGDVPVRIVDPMINPMGQRAASAQFYLVQGGEAMDDERWEAAVAAYEKAIEIDPSALRPYIAVAVAREQLGDRQGAARSLAAGLADADPADAEEEGSAQRYLGRLLVMLGRDEEAVPRFQRSLELLPDQAAVRVDLADAYARLGRWQPALAELDALLTAEARTAPALLARRGAVLVNLGRRDEALAAYRRAVGAAPDDAALRLRYAAALEHFGRGDEARRERQEAERRAGGTGEEAELALAEGRRLEAEGRHAEALAVYERAALRAPDSSEARLRRGLLLGHLGRLEEAREELARAVAAAPEAREPRRSEITALVLLGRYGEARVKLNEALRLFPLDLELARVSARLLAAAPDARVRDGQLAVRQAAAIYKAAPGPVSAEILAMAFAEAGQAERAESLQRQVVEAVQSGGDLALLQPVRDRLLLYQRGEAWHASRPDEILASPLETGLDRG